MVQGKLVSCACQNSIHIGLLSFWDTIHNNNIPDKLGTEVVQHMQLQKQNCCSLQWRFIETLHHSQELVEAQSAPFLP